VGRVERERDVEKERERERERKRGRDVYYWCGGFIEATFRL